MNKLSKLTALLLAIVLALGVPMQVMAESLDTLPKYEAEVSKILAQLYDALMASTTYEEVREATKSMARTEIVNFLARLLEDQVVTDDFVAYDEYLWALYEEYIDRETFVIPVNYTEAAPLVNFSYATEAASTFSLLSRDGEPVATAETDDSGIELDKSAVLDSTTNQGLITLEAYSTGTSTTTVTGATAVDIILILDLSKSMDGTGGNDYAYIPDYGHTPLSETATPQSGTTYYVLYEKMYVPVSYCSTCQAWTYGCYHGTYKDTNEMFGIQFTHSADTPFCTRTTSVTEDDDHLKIAALKRAVINFVAEMQEMSQNTDNRLAFVKFNSNDAAAIVIKEDTNIAAGSAFINMKTNAQNAVETANGTALWKTSQGTYIDDGTQKAVDILDAYYPNGTGLESRKRVVIVFTDGEPSGTKSATATNAIYDTWTIKNTYKSTVYSVGVVDDADGSIPFTSHSTSTRSFNINQFLHFMSSNFPNATNYTGWTVPDYPNPGSYYLSAGDTTTLNNIFSAIAGQIKNELDKSTSLGTTTSVTDVLTPYFKLPDGVTEDNISEHVKVYAVPCTGGAYDATNDTASNLQFAVIDDTHLFQGTDEGKVVLNEDGSISVTGFDFANEWCGPVVENGEVESWHGRKLVITIPFTPTPDFIGGNDVVTNEETSGIYKPSVDENGDPVLDEDGNQKMESVKPFPVPDVDVTFKSLQINGADQYIYLSNYADLNVLLQNFEVKYTFANGGTEYTVNGYNNGYVALRFKLTDPINNSEIYFTILPGAENGIWTYVVGGKEVPGTQGEEIRRFLENDTTYEISYEVFARENVNKDGTIKTVTNTDGTVEEVDPETEGSLNATVYVFKPVLTFQDTTHKYLAQLKAEDLADYYLTKNFVSEAWYNEQLGCYSTERVMMNGPLPELSYTFDPASESDPESPKDVLVDSNSKVKATACIPVNIKKISATSTYSTTSTVNGTITETKTPYVMGDISAHVTSFRQETPCTCEYDGEEIVDKETYPRSKVGDVSIEEFVIHITDVLGDLIIQKTGLRTGESAIFTATITPPANSGEAVKEYTVVLTGTSPDGETTVSVTLADLLANSTYSVVESGDWSWRYAQTDSSDTSGSIVAAGEVTASFTNSRDDQWLDDEVAVQNNFSVNGPGTVID